MTVNYQLEYLLRDNSRRRHVLTGLSELKDYLDVSGKTVVEYGSGLGTNLEIFSNDNEVLGLEGLSSAVDAANANGIRSVQADLDVVPTPIEDNFADVIICTDVLEHLVKVDAIVEDMLRVAKPGAHIIWNVPNHFTLKGRLKILLGSGMDVHGYFPTADDWDNPHVRFFTFWGVRRLAAKHLLSIDRDYSFRGTVELLSNPNESRWKKLAKTLLYKFSPSLVLGGFFLVLRTPTKTQ